MDPTTDTRLANLVTWGVDLDPPFQPDVHHYTVVVAASVEQLKLSAVPVQVRHACPPSQPKPTLCASQHACRSATTSHVHHAQRNIMKAPARPLLWRDGCESPENPNRRRDGDDAETTLLPRAAYGVGATRGSGPAAAAAALGGPAHAGDGGGGRAVRGGPGCDGRTGSLGTPRRTAAAT